MSTFTFVTHNGPRPEHRGLVKSHVMRESQKKRKEAKQQQHARKSKLSLFAPKVEKRKVDAMSGEEDSALSSGKLKPDVNTNCYFSKNGTNADNNSSFPRAVISNYDSPHYESKMELSNFQMVPRRSFALAIQNNQKKKWLRVYLTSVYAQSSKIHQEPEPHTSELDPGEHLYSGNIESQQPHPCPTGCVPDLSWILENVSERLSEIYAHYATSFYKAHPENAFEDPTRFWDSEHTPANSKILVGSVLLYSMYKFATSNDDHQDHFTGYVLELVNKSMMITDGGLSEDDIAFIMSVCMYENFRGRASVVTHLQGLNQLTSMRPSQNYVLEHDQYLGNLIRLQDFIYSTCSNSPPTHFKITEPTLRAVQFDFSSLESDHPQSPLRILNSGSLHETVGPHLESLAEVLVDAFDAFEIMCIRTFDPDTAADASCLFQAREAEAWCRLQDMRNTKSQTSVSKSADDDIWEAVTFAAVIHFRAVALQIAHSDAVNAAELERLYTATTAIAHDCWDKESYIYLWILLTGAAASAYQPAYRSFFADEILRLGVCLGSFEWELFNATMSNFLWLQQYLRAR
ncbi:unnamed protein product [Periconia digitata]|uniref:Uncharacterized protein n=1 Tax=Periconia digitata TaxID=1303443 RepID=A0A9W4XPW5_9PLEO|nr:unnamed protein product [Periconia digitata]